MAEAFCKIRARLGATRLVLADAAPTSRELHSKLQREVLESMIAESLNKLKADQRASLATMVSMAKFSAVDEDNLLQILAGSAKSKSQPNRRHSQDFVCFIEYLGSDDWCRLKEAGCDGALELCIEILIVRFYCVNPDEYTLKRIACLAMLLAALHFDCNAKKAVLKKVKERYQKLKRKFNATLRKQPELAGPYIEKLPNSPKEFERLYPNAIARFKVERNWVPPQIDVSAIYRIEVTFGCRGLDEASSLHKMGAMDSNNGNTMAMCMQLIRDLASRNDRKNDGINLTFPPKRKRQLGDGFEHETETKRMRQLADGFEHETEIDCGMARRRARTVTEFDGVSTPDKDESKLAPGERHEPEPVKAEPLALADAASKSAPLSDAAANEDSKVDSKERVGALLDSLLERDKERAIAAREKAAEAKKAKKEIDALLKERESGLTTPLKAPPKAKPEVSPQASPKAPPKAKIEVSPKASPKANSKKKEGIELEQSRNQYLVRLNIGSKSFRFGPGYAYSTQEKANKEAMKWFEKNKSG